jgi:hypothetical protein
MAVRHRDHGFQHMKEGFRRDGIGPAGFGHVLEPKIIVIADMIGQADEAEEQR